MASCLVSVKPLTNAGILLIGPLGRNFSEILSELNSFVLNKMHLEMLSAKFCLNLNLLTFPTH